MSLVRLVREQHPRRLRSSLGLVDAIGQPISVEPPDEQAERFVAQLLQPLVVLISELREAAGETRPEPPEPLGQRGLTVVLVRRLEGTPDQGDVLPDLVDVDRSVQRRLNVCGGDVTGTSIRFDACDCRGSDRGLQAVGRASVAVAATG
jgi:hypothetical protein